MTISIIVSISVDIISVVIDVIINKINMMMTLMKCCRNFKIINVMIM